MEALVLHNSHIQLSLNRLREVLLAFILERRSTMQTKMQFQKNADVISANGESVGRIDRVVVNPENNVVTHLVVHKSTLFNPEDKLVPVELVTETSPEQIVLHYEAGDLESCPPFEQERIV